MFLTMESASVAMDEAFAALPEEIAGTDEQVDAMAALSGAIIKGALLGARGNSGVILSQILRGMVKVDPISGNSLKPTAEAVRAGLRQAADMAYAAVGKPKEGTILSVIRAAAETAAATDTDDLEVMIEAVARGAREALARTPEQLDVLKRAGVVDSGGRGMVVIMDALAEVVTGRRAPAGPAQARVPQPEFAPGTDYDGPPFEVMYLLDARDDAIPRLKEELSDLGDSLVVVGGDGLWNIHVHVTDAGAAIERGMGAGRPYRIRITWLVGETEAEEHDHESMTRGVVCVAHGPGVARLLQQSGVVPLAATPGVAPSTGELLEAALSTGAREVVLLPSDKNTKSAAEAAAAAGKDRGMRIAVVPTSSIVESLAAIAVHDPGRGFDDDVVSMSRAAGATAYGGITMASREAVTSVGVCEPGDIIGVVGGDILEIGDDVVDVAQRTLDRLLAAGGEMVTMVTGSQADEAEIERLSRYLRNEYPGVEEVVYEGGQPLWPIIVGVE